MTSQWLPTIPRVSYYTPACNTGLPHIGSDLCDALLLARASATLDNTCTTHPIACVRHCLYARTLGTWARLGQGSTAVYQIRQSSCASLFPLLGHACLHQLRFHIHTVNGHAGQQPPEIITFAVCCKTYSYSSAVNEAAKCSRCRRSA